MKPSEAVSKTISVLETFGWCQFEFENDDGRHCLLGAINKALFDSYLEPVDGDVSLKTTIRHKINEHLGTSLMAWNDEPSRTPSQVLNLLQAVKSDFEGLGQ